MTLFDIRVPWITLWHSDPLIRIRIAPPASEGYFRFFSGPTWYKWTRESEENAVRLLD